MSKSTLLFEYVKTEKTDYQIPITLFFAIIYFSICSRAIAEIYLTKFIGYIIQVILWLIFMIFIILGLFTKNREFIADKEKILIVYFIFIVSVIISSLITLNFMMFDLFWIYSGISIFLSSALLISAIVRQVRGSTINFPPVIATIAIIIIAFGIWEQIMGVSLVGANYFHQEYVRPGSLTGSMLHYPTLISLMAIMLIEIYEQNKKLIYLLIAFMASIASIISLTRSGVMILSLTFAFYYLQAIMQKRVSRFALFIFIFFILLTPVFFYFSENVIISRVISSLDLDSPGNTARVDSWKSALEMFGDSPILFGKRTGMITNATNRLSTVDTIVVESSFFQLLLNFGLIGCISFYLLFLSLIRRVDKRHLWLRAAIIAAFCQSFIYQSIETVPFMFTICLIPLVSDFISVGIGDGPQKLDNVISSESA